MATYTITGDAWSGWVTYSTGTTTATDTTWSGWSTGDAGTATTTDVVWYGWQSASDSYVQVQPQRTAEQDAAWRKAVDEKNKERADAQARALQLLKEMLTKTQLEAFEQNKCIPVDAPSGQKYVIERGYAGNVYAIKSGKRVEKFCIHPNDGDIPVEDVMLAQKLLLESNEGEFRRIANVTRLAA